MHTALLCTIHSTHFSALLFCTITPFSCPYAFEQSIYCTSSSCFFFFHLPIILIRQHSPSFACFFFSI
ncbi:hypothetical protein K450DRAFT_261047 [Umbelopsis ramanniana AG]|uniref:Uncharacterized protein n=1 Tax=Umbelopsis ramanniana AG TaxID=1314678 RepID=A0AAD5E387_UMBRA|nr:uncharacterized protein K450DRAFT_261047 [Umbelopsis ramanniana AG]KAI8575585.1 hypothetical protein K450DRAFT_261047 [Umbelopsis ramanniana AG]